MLDKLEVSDVCALSFVVIMLLLFLSIQIVSEIEELNVDLNSTKSDLKASNIERDKILKTVNTTLVMQVSIE